MADIELVIKIDEKHLEYIHKAVAVDGTAPPYFVVENLWESVLNGTPLPKGLGKLVDVDAVIDSLKGIERLHTDDELRSSILNTLYTNTLEADKESEDKE